MPTKQNLTKKSIFVFPLLVICGISFSSCDKEEAVVEEQFELINTLGNSTVGNGSSGHIEDYFYDLDDNIEVDFYLFNNASFGFDYNGYLGLYNKEPTQLLFKTYPQLVVTETPNSLDTSAYLKISSDSPAWLEQRTSLDPENCPSSLCNSGLEISFNEAGKVIEDSVALFSTQFKNIDKLTWSFNPILELQRYMPDNSDWLFQSDTIKFTDELDIVSYYSVVQALPDSGEGAVFVDASEWEKYDFEYSSEQTAISKEFYFPSWRRLGGDSLIFRINTDCNDNGAFDAEPESQVSSEEECEDGETYIETSDSSGFCDRGNGLWDPAEVFVDNNDDGLFDSDSEPFEDRNCNGRRDEEEEFDDQNGNGAFDPGEFNPVEHDVGNGIFDTAEQFTDDDGNGIIESDELYIFDLAPKTLLVNWEDQNNPVPMTTVYPGDSLTSRWNITYYDIIKETERTDLKTTYVDNLDSLVTQYNNKIIEEVGDESLATDYYVTKTEWVESDPSFGDVRYYDYHIFKMNENIYKLVHPSYFKPYGYHGFTYDRQPDGTYSIAFSSDGYDDGFWYKANAVDEMLYHTSNGLFRDGEVVNEEYYDTTSVGIYFVRKSQEVFSDSVTVPAKSVRGVVDGSGGVQCFTESDFAPATIAECPAVDTTFSDCFKIIRSVNMTMIGSGVEWEEENTTWVVRDYGIVKSELKVRWGESIWFDSDAEVWLGYSRWEMGHYSAEVGDGGALQKMLGQFDALHLNELGQVDDLNNDPYQPRRTMGLHRVQIPKDQ